MAPDEAQQLAGADGQSGHEGGLALLPPGLRPDGVGVVEVAGVEQALVDQAGLDQPEGGAEQQDRRPATPGAAGELADEHRDRAVQRAKITSPASSTSGLSA